jgi:hypothetical protein
MGPLEQEILELIQAPAQRTLGSLLYAAGDRDWFTSLSRDERDELLLLSLAGISDALRRLAREIDESRGSVPDDGND